jgi:hypothetical protein
VSYRVTEKVMSLFQGFYELVRHFIAAVLIGFGRPLVFPPFADEKLFRFPSNVSPSKVSDFIFTASGVVEESKHHQFAKIFAGGEHRIHEGLWSLTFLFTFGKSARVNTSVLGITAVAFVIVASCSLRTTITSRPVLRRKVAKSLR